MTDVAAAAQSYDAQVAENWSTPEAQSDADALAAAFAEIEKSNHCWYCCYDYCCYEYCYYEYCYYDQFLLLADLRRVDGHRPKLLFDRKKC